MRRYSQDTKYLALTQNYYNCVRGNSLLESLQGQNYGRATSHEPLYWLCFILVNPPNYYKILAEYLGF